MIKNRITFVCPWFGSEMSGGAERHTWEVATRLAERGHDIHVLTTCSKSFLDDWATNHYPAGKSTESGITVHRFKVDPRKSQTFDDANRYLLSQELGTSPENTQLDKKHTDAFVQENINSVELQKYISDNVDNYNNFVFIPYLYGTTLLGMRSCKNKAILNPCLHDEAYAYIPEVAEAFHSASHILCLSEGEKYLAEQLYGPAMFKKATVVGAGIEAPDEQSAKPLYDNFPNKFVLCLGRRGREKGIEQLIEAWKLYKSKNEDTALKLVLAGPGKSSYDNPEQGIIDLELVSSPEKKWLLDNCISLLQPSPNESFSRVLMEAWQAGKSAVVNKSCHATRCAMETSQGGWVADSAEDWCNIIGIIANSTETELLSLAMNGKEYASQYANWEHVLDAYEKVLFKPPHHKIIDASPAKDISIHQLLPTLSVGDAISNQALWLKDIFQSVGVTSEIYVKTCSPELINQVKIVDVDTPPANEGLLFHHSIGNEITGIAVNHVGPKALLYHNITPSYFFENYDTTFAKLLKNGRDDLAGLSKHFTHTYADSQYNAEELTVLKFKDTEVLPIIVDPSRWNQKPDYDISEIVSGELKNILFVGRVAPNKGHLNLIDAFYKYLCIDTSARLILAGYIDYQAEYTKQLLKKIDDYGIASRILILGSVTEGTLYSLYRTADLFWSFSDHEGFCVPIVEAMWFNVPVLAYNSSAVPETLGEAGMIFTDNQNPKIAAALAYNLLHNEPLKEEVLSAQQQRREDFTYNSTLPLALSVVDKFRTIQ